MADKKVSELTELANISGDDLLMVVNDPSGTPSSRKITATKLFKTIPVNTTFSANTTFSGGEMTVSANLIYKDTEISSLIDTKISVTNAAIATSKLWGGITGTNTAIRAVVATNAATELSHLANTNAYIADESARVTLVNTNLTGTNTAIRTLVSDRMQVANVEANYVANSSFQSYIANTNPRIDTLETDFITGTTVVFQSPIVNATTNANTPIIKVSTATGIQATKGSAPSSNNTATEGVPVGTIFFSNNHLYIATDATTIKRVSLEVFS